jgi:cytidylate kinase
LKTQLLSKEDVLSGLVVAIDGPAGSGKSTTARLISRRLGYRHIDTGAMYRAVALKALRAGVDPQDAAACGALASAIRIHFEESADGPTVMSDGEDVSRDIRSPEVTRAVSPVSAHPAVRVAMVQQQRDLALQGGAVLEGRDIGTVVLPAADVKVFLVASTAVRAERRMKELRAQGTDLSVEEVERDIVLRDEYDSSRQTSPLRRAVGALLVDTSDLTIEEQVDRIAEITQQTAARLLDLEPASRFNAYLRTRPHYGFARALIRGVMKLLFGLRMDIKSQVDYKENYIFACNHKSYADPPFAGSTLQREVYIVAKAGLFRNRVFAWLIRTFNAIPMRRGVFDREAMNTVVDLLGQGRSLMIFPEGSRVYTGDLGKARSGVGYLAVNSGVAVVPLFVSGTNRLWRCLFRRERLHVSIGRPLRIAPETREQFAHNDGYREYAEMVLEAIRALKTEYEAAPPGAGA